MFKSVCRILCLFCLSACVADIDVECTDLDVTNCGFYKCIIDNVPTATDPNALGCVEDACTTAYERNGACNTVSGGNECKKVSYTLGGGLDQLPDVCVSVSNHFSDCRLTFNDLADIYNAVEDKDSYDYRPMNQYCTDRGCGGLYLYVDNDNTPYFHCEEPGEDGTLDPEDFDDAAFCNKHFQYTFIDGKCTWDPCALNEDANSCPSQCTNITSGDSSLCIKPDPNNCVSKSWNLDAIKSSDDCAAIGCGGLDVAKSKRGKTYLFCKPPPPKNSALYIHVPIFVVLMVTIFAFL